MNNDLISRSALKKAIAEFHKEENERLHNPLWDSIGLNALNRLIDNAPTVEMPNDILKAYYLGYSQAQVDLERPQGEQKDIDIPKMCEECHSQSYNNGFDAGYELGKKDAQKHITELNERIEFLMQQIRLWQKWETTVQQGKDCSKNQKR